MAPASTMATRLISCPVNFFVIFVFSCCFYGCESLSGIQYARQQLLCIRDTCLLPVLSSSVVESYDSTVVQHVQLVSTVNSKTSAVRKQNVIHKGQKSTRKRGRGVE